MLRLLTGRRHFGHVFLVPYNVLRFMVRVATAKYSTSALLLAPVLWLPVWATTQSLLGKLRRAGHGDLATEIARHVLSPDLLFGEKPLLLARKPTR